ncbi:MAG: hypothetical protein M1828_005967 [Chrysothrix sp. TS-e1954]|nr:MAG: hypothetical protein M1828_005967 [Chrysothrix sp. TS-e1954]
MSLLGSIPGNYDATAATTGVGGGTAFIDRPTEQGSPQDGHQGATGNAADNRFSHISKAESIEQPEDRSFGASKRDSKDTSDTAWIDVKTPHDSKDAPEYRGSSSDSLFEDDELEKRDKEVHKLARKLTSRSSLGGESTENLFEAKEGSSLDPHSANFRPRSWAKSLLNLQARDPEHYKPRTAGFSFRNLNAYGFGSATDYQKSVGNIVLEGYGLVRKLFGVGQHRIDILRNLDGVVHNGEMLVVLGPPGSGCSTFLKTISGETHGFFVTKDSVLNYQGIEADQFHKDFRGEATYTAEIDVHFPQLTVGDTLAFAAKARSPRKIPGGLSRDTYSKFMRDVVMAMFGISHTINTNVGNDFVRGVSGGERKRVTIAEAALSGAPLQCWDNSTRGLDSANALEFCRTVRMSTDLYGSTAAVSIYQSSQSAYDIFDKVLVLYEGRQIFFGNSRHGKDYFINMGFYCPERQTVPDFLTSMTSALEREVRDGFEHQVPRTPDEFAERWKNSEERAALMLEIDQWENQHQYHGEDLKSFKASRRAQQSKIQRVQSSYTLSYYGQTMLCLQRGFQRLKGDPSLTFTQAFGNAVMAMVIGSIFYNLQPDTNSFFSRGALLFFAILLNAFGSALEILTLYAQRPIVEKQSRYAFYHPSCEALASMLTDMPYKIVNAFSFNVPLYFLSNLNRTPGAFFFFVLISFTITLVMSMLFRTIASVSRTLSQALAPAAIIILAIIIYTGFAIPVPYMLGWSRWINYLDPVAYAFESLMVNEFHNRNFTCSIFVPTGGDYDNVRPLSHICEAVGSTAGSSVVSGTAYIESSFEYYHSHKWRNVGIIIAFMIGLCAAYLLGTEYISSRKSKGEVLLFRRGHKPAFLKKSPSNDLEATPSKVMRQVGVQHDNRHSGVIEKQTSVFHWEDVSFDIKIKSEPRRILDRIDGWVQPGTLTALMGVSGAGKTTLLDVLATRTTIGVISGDIFVDGRQRDESFQRKTGYVQQQDLHLPTSTVREALNFSALLRQPAHIPKAEKLEYVEEVILLLEMDEYADAVVGVPGEGLNVEQRKRLTIAVELAARPQLLLFFDEPTSGLDSQTSWAICDLMEKLTKSGQAVLCTIHQPSAMLFTRFDRLLFLAAGGKTVYFGDVGDNSSVLTKYFEKNGASPCPPSANPAEWMLEVIGAAPGSHSDIDWHEVWRKSPELVSVKQELARLREVRPQETKPAANPEDKASYREFAAPFWVQQWEVSKRVFAQYWRTPSYIYSKVALCLFSALFIGFTFYNSGTSQQALQNQMFGIFLLFTIFGQLVQQIMPHFVAQRALYEARERPSKTYSWKAFMLSNILVELPWNTLMGVIIFLCIYYPIGMYKNAAYTGATHSRGALFFLLVLEFMLFTSSFTNMVIAPIDTAETAGNIASLTFSLTLIFCGVLVTPTALPGFWIFMYYLSPFTYLVDAMLATGLANAPVTCAANEIKMFDPALPNQTCGDYMDPFIQGFGGYLQNRDATHGCEFCALSSTNTFLIQVSSSYSHRWRNFGIMWAFIIFNIAAAVFLYWAVRVPKAEKKRKTGEGPQSLERTMSSTSRKGGLLAGIAGRFKVKEKTGGGEGEGKAPAPEVNGNMENEKETTV